MTVPVPDPTVADAEALLLERVKDSRTVDNVRKVGNPCGAVRSGEDTLHRPAPTVLEYQARIGSGRRENK